MSTNTVTPERAEELTRTIAECNARVEEMQIEKRRHAEHIDLVCALLKKGFGTTDLFEVEVLQHDAREIEKWQDKIRSLLKTAFLAELEKDGFA